MCGRGRVGIGKDRSVPVVLDELMLDLDVRTASATKTRRELLYLYSPVTKERGGGGRDDEMPPWSSISVPGASSCFMFACVAYLLCSQSFHHVTLLSSSKRGSIAAAGRQQIRRLTRLDSLDTCWNLKGLEKSCCIKRKEGDLLHTT